jgi:hypothetical protein
MHSKENQISSFSIYFTKYVSQSSKVDMIRFLFIHIITMFINLQCFDFGQSSNGFQELSFDISSSTVFSSNLLELHVSV